ncbi:MAG: DUF2975 domain-containing protein [Simkania sp.]|nr:DUF2975 domain-containing protein [Simkania sp.]
MNYSPRKIRTLSRVLKLLFFITALALPVIVAGAWITNGYPFLKPLVYCSPFPEISGISIKPFTEIPAHTKLIGFLISLIPVAFQTTALLLLVRLFGLFERFEFFSQKSVICIQRLGWCLLIGQLVYPLYLGLLTLALTISNPPGERTISVAFGMEQLHLVIIATIIILVSWVMNEGRKLQDEQAATI